MLFGKLLKAAVLSVAAVQTAALTIGGKPNMMIKSYKREALQDLVTWDEQSLFVRGERVLFYSGEFHPFRLPVPSLWLDVFQKIKALGYNGVSVYFDWALLEGKPGQFEAEGVFALEPFFEAAQTAGIYLIARPGPYINAEVSGGGYPGWMQRVPALLRTRDPAYLEATQNYVVNIAKLIAAAQITNGGPVVLFQPENEYSQATDNIEPFPDPMYFQYVEDQFRNNSIVVPFISNDARPQGYFAPGPPRQEAALDIYGHDGYPLGFDCANPYTWPDNALPTNYRDLHENQSSSTPYSIVEFQGGAFDPWGGPGFAKCTALLGPEFERVFYKNIYSFGATIFSTYMTYGGTNWGNLGHPGGYTSYDYGAVITEERTVDREKYSQAKLQAQFLQASPAYLTAFPQNNSNANGSYTGNGAIATTALLGNVTNFYIVRHGAYNTLDTTDYRFNFPTSKGNITVDGLSLHGRDSKVFVSDYDVGGINLLYSTAEIFTWKQYGNKRVLVVYGGPGETNELAIAGAQTGKCVEGQGVTTDSKNGVSVIRFKTSSERKVVEVGDDLSVYILDRNSAYNYWVIDLADDSVTKNYTNYKHATSAPIVKAGYLLRTVQAHGSSLHLTGDINCTNPVEVIGAPEPLHELTFNGESLNFKQAKNGVVTATAEFKKPELTVPDLSSIGWKVIDTLPEIESNYDDSAWTVADLTYSNNTIRNLTTPTSLYSSDYGYHTGNLIYRGHFKANGGEKELYLATQGGSAYGHSLWLNDEFVGSFYGGDKYYTWNTTYTLPNTVAGKDYVITVLIDNMGLDEAFTVGSEQMKRPRGVIDFNLNGHNKSSVTWKLTGNLHGEDYEDHTRGPLNEGGLYAERQGYHLPGAPTSDWKDSKTGPMEGIDAPGVAFYATEFDLEFPQGYDIPLSFSFTNSSTNTSATTPSYRCQLYVNGYQFGKYVYNIGPQDSFPVPEGIWNYQGSNYVAVSLWALEKEGAKVEKLELVAGTPVQSGFGPIELAPQTGWKKREGAY
ncbi:putative beta-galactosidase A [Fulvia fulva]|uniref:Beta-galactosidase n=1 Tax=Passalora fulva TaxID=5499 RepID=A0A9Q8USN6_PASFU|nr:putative beta-galactosidase A [Fulvia fulva]KAK4618252.1 putative beta-galactosidase A [Fulvia fulva]KAK4618443.1 putative beta-galactosidase A [Fulvia fulva]UJO21024.1 putative beta-galactosidase A [Fulvia fulva]WPV18158.1 putative beta-galactosidase A [Fulvia fulva]WPV33270.1 putative beta-galactosidase A [Fulvia fulva]